MIVQEDKAMQNKKKIRNHGNEKCSYGKTGQMPK